MVLTPLLGAGAKGLVSHDHPVARYFPAFWFVGVYECMRPATGSAALRELGRTGLWGLGIATAVFLLGWLPGYRRHARKIVEASGRALDGMLLRGALERTAPADLLHTSSAAIWPAWRDIVSVMRA